MSTTELLIDSIIIALIVGALVGGIIVDLLVAEPWRRKAEIAHRRVTRAQVRAATRPHLGTPYIDRTPFNLPPELFPLVDDHNASRKAAGLEVVR